MRETASDYAVSYRGNGSPSAQESADSVTVPELRRLVREWVLDGQIRGLSPKTLRERSDVLDKLLWLAEREGWHRVGPRQVGSFLSHVRVGHEEPGGRWGAASRDSRLSAPPSAATLMAYFRQVRCLGNWLVDEGVLESTILGNRKAPVSRPHQVTPFTPAQVEALITAARKSSHPKRNEAIVLFMVDTGARASEVCGLSNGDLELSSRRAILTATKGSKKRNVFFGKRCTRALYSLLLEAGTKGDPEVPVFLSDRGIEAGGRLTSSGLRQLFERLGEVAHIEGVRCSPHTCRHFYAIEFLRAGGSLFSLQQALGHTSLTMVKRYVAWAEADLERQSKQFSPADRLGKR